MSIIHVWYVLYYYHIYIYYQVPGITFITPFDLWFGWSAKQHPQPFPPSAVLHPVHPPPPDSPAPCGDPRRSNDPRTKFINVQKIMIAMFKILYKQLLKLHCWVTGNTFGRLLVLYSSRNPQGLHTQCTFALDLQPTELTQMSTTQYPSHSVFFQNPEPWLLLLAVLQVIPMDSWAIYVWVGCQQRGSEAKKRSKPKSARDFL